MSTAANLHTLPEVGPAADVERRRSLRWILLVAVPLVGALVFGAFWLTGGRSVGTDNAYVQADKVPISVEVTGTVANVFVRENQAVHAGDPLFELDRAPFEVAVARAEANLGEARTNLEALRASYREKQVEIGLARTRHAFALKDQKRQVELAAKDYAPQVMLDQADQNAQLTADQVKALDQQLAQIGQTLGGGPNVPLEQHPTYKVALAELAQAKLDLARTLVRAPLDGAVSDAPKPGQHLAAGGMAMVVVASGAPRIEANLTEKDLTWVHPGQPVTVRVDTYPGRSWRGTVESLSPATGAEFSLLPAQNATGNWVKIAQRVPVRIALDPAPDLAQLRAGLSAEVKIDTGHKRRLFGMTL
jgi:membrane fusion protein (multidrug efflux system)